ncbi:AGL135Wp [Eremothecium gossypii ATCC 10895]|uniref:AGL135Wp n=1 Tax=Eremothecium gossypii (strain ATCC 10895 / CBS 109.51 / FGSC 9923 / NRRL Y-1056) TaxID=284811 RepID=Q750S4_EREGS|nr:AGL135Wp [Eremothecium gossypii ATCC 10895]AAS54356.1 AGL135Wp [Eremothecium gossypii ATCC 10895]AEY98683.1 FAGL135Wp [Eremothecium gossypii FDAG1]
MSSILYNANSRLVVKYQKKYQLATSSLESEDEGQDEPFSSTHPKDSREYLLDLCCNVYPKHLSSRLQTLPDWSLAIHALVALLFKNFVKTWYGEKIPTTDDALLVLLFDICDETIKNIHASEVNWSQILWNDIPQILDSHMGAMSQVMTEHLTYSEFEQLNLYKGQYPGCLVAKINEISHNRSELQRAFLDGFIGDLILGKIVSKTVAPFILIDIIRSTCDKLLLIHDVEVTVHVEADLKSRIWSKITKAFKLIQDEQVPDMKAAVPIGHSYIFTFFKNMFSLERRKPTVYSLVKAVQILVDKVYPFSYLALKLVGCVNRAILNNSTIQHASIAFRHALFPKDNKMAPGKLEPTEEEFLILKVECIKSLWNVCAKYRLPTVLGLKKQDVEDFVEAICYDARMNQFLIYRISECLLGRLTEE